MENWREYFVDKKVTIMGIHPEGRGVQDAEFIAGLGAEVTVTDQKEEVFLKESVERLKNFKNITFHLGGHQLEDFRDKDLIIRAASAPLDSPYLKEAINNGIEIQTDETLFFKLAPKLRTVGVTGTRGKSTVTQMIYEIVKASGTRVWLGGNIRGLATLPLLSEVNEGDIMVMELDSWKLQSFGYAKLSPSIAVFTNFYPDHQNYYNGMDDYFADKANIFKNQNSGDDLIIYEQVHERVVNEDFKSDLFIVRDDNLADLDLKIPGRHNIVNASLALAAANSLEIPMDLARKSLESFSGVEGRLQFVKDIDGVFIYNDNNATSPDATIAGLRALGEEIILIMGGADKSLDMSGLVKEIKDRVSICVLLPGSGTDLVSEDISGAVTTYEAKDLEEAMKIAIDNSSTGQSILFSPAFASFGLFKNEYDRNDQFLNILEKI